MMLVLSRFKDQELLVGGGIRIVIVDVERASGRVKIGIEAPPDVQVVRREIMDKFPPVDGHEALYDID